MNIFTPITAIPLNTENEAVRKQFFYKSKIFFGMEDRTLKSDPVDPGVLLPSVRADACKY
jgi:hypothetical protein